MCFQCCRVSYQAGFEENPRIHAVSSGTNFKGLCHSPQPFSHLTTLGAFREELHVFITYFFLCVCVCVYIKHYMKYWKTDVHNMSWGFFGLNCGNFSNLCMLPLHWPAALTYPRCCHLRKCLHYSDLITVSLASISFVSSPLSWWLVVFPFFSFSAQFSSVLISLLFFSFIAFPSFLWLEQLSCLQTRILLTVKTHLFCKLSSLIPHFSLPFYWINGKLFWVVIYVLGSARCV